MANYMGQRVDTSHSGGLRVKEFWIVLFQDNERYWKRGELNRILSDAQISLAMHAAFPTRRPLLFEQVSRVRSRYNAGIMGVTPCFRSHTYTREGRIIQRRTARGRVLESIQLKD